MASAFAHAFVAASVGAAVVPRRFAPRVIGVGLVCSILPDVDVLGFALGIPYGDLLGHRGLTHSLLFALATALVATPLFFSGPAWRPLRVRIGVTLFAITASHGLLDAMTDGGLGVAFLSPFDPTRSFLPVRPVQVSPIGVAEFFTRRSLGVLASELVFIALPAGLLALAIYAGRCAWERGRASGPPGSASS